MAFWQARILDLEQCCAVVPSRGLEVEFGLELTDPLEDHAPEAAIGGDYVVRLGERSSAEAGTSTGLPMLKASVNALTRLWLGVRSASSLAISDDLSGPPELLADLDRALMLPPPRMGWFF
jgi:hypothetical protein